MTTRLPLIAAHDREALRGLYARGWEPQAETTARVAEIIATVRREGDAALAAYTHRYDTPNLATPPLAARIPTTAAARTVLPDRVAEALELAHDRVAAFHRRQQIGDRYHVDDDGTVSAMLIRPLGAVGAYVPGGTARLPSSVIMAAVPAKIAGVDRVVVVTPPRPDGSIDPAILYACALCRVDELYAVGGAQAIAALAYGTATILPVDKIVGPGNLWVTEAKRQVFGICGIDGLAGPSEVLVVADESADPRLVAAELVAQAEHDPLARVAVVSDDRTLLERVADLLASPFATECGREATVTHVLEHGTYLIAARDRHEILDVIERFAPEHLHLAVRDPWSISAAVQSAGAIFAGEQTPVACGDYLAGSNHTLPTSGAARFSSGLRTADFERTVSLIANSTARMEHDAPLLEAIAAFEGLPAHARTARLRRKGTTA